MAKKIPRPTTVKIHESKSEIRIDEIHDRYIIVAPKRSMRPHDVAQHQEVPVKSKDCPFCRETEMMSQPPLYLEGPDNWWEIKVIKNVFPFVSPGNPKAYGHQEVIIETPHHNKEMAEFSDSHVYRVLKAYAARTKALSRDKKIKYIIIFKNHGGKAGASLVHAHSQILATGFVPSHIINKLARAEEYLIEHGISYYAKLAQTEAKGPRCIMTNKYLTVFCPYASSYNYEVWIVPHRQVDNITLLEEEELKAVAHALKLIIKKVNELGLPYNYYMHQTITEPNEYFYLRICPRRDTWAGVELGSRVVINSVAPEEAAKFYRRR
ncbi:MAG: DUF4931 domain-containing protein [Patescibacteria group bacterium]|nr:DUF4931 domain-containing protein [Patescibacteria group bacterium]MDD5715971.1 DUF4931 domain-containing protein [Patescibacteria group bacterium]